MWEMKQRRLQSPATCAQWSMFTPVSYYAEALTWFTQHYTDTVSVLDAGALPHAWEHWESLARRSGRASRCSCTQTRERAGRGAAPGALHPASTSLFSLSLSPPPSLAAAAAASTRTTPFGRSGRGPPGRSTSRSSRRASRRTSSVRVALQRGVALPTCRPLQTDRPPRWRCRAPPWGRREPRLCGCKGGLRHRGRGRADRDLLRGHAVLVRRGRLHVLTQLAVRDDPCL